MNVGSVNINNSLEMVPSFSSSHSMAPQEETQQEDWALSEFVQKQMKEEVAISTLRTPRKWWTPEEDKVIVQFASRGDWVGAAKQLEETGRSPRNCRDHWRKVIEKQMHEGRTRRKWWTPEEDEILLQHVPQRDWKGAAERLKKTGRSPEQCSSRWRSVLEKTLSGSHSTAPQEETQQEDRSLTMQTRYKKWTPEEDEILVQYVPHWKAASKQLKETSRSPQHCRYRWRKLKEARLSGSHSTAPAERLKETGRSPKNCKDRGKKILGKRKRDNEDKADLEPASKEAKMADSIELKDLLTDEKMQELNCPQHELAIHDFQSIDLDDFLMSYQNEAEDF